MKLNELNIRLHALTVFRSLMEEPVLKALLRYLECRGAEDIQQAVSAYAEFAAQLYEHGGGNLSAHIRSIVNDNENVYMRLIGEKKQPSASMQKCVEEEIATLQAIAELTEEELRAGLSWEGYLPQFDTEKIDLAKDYRERTGSIAKYGYGIYARYHMFYISDDGHIVPVRYPDPVRLSMLVDYKREQQIIIDNTKALLAGKPAANMLLTGDAGTGKSSTIKAVVNEFYGEGLRIIQVRKEQLREISAILDELTTNPLKFILFIDDLSFQKDDDNFSALKAVLEGSVSTKSQNVVIYATSNRRHIVKERFGDREGDDVHCNDTIQEIISLSERFGLQVTFQKPNKQTYLDIVHHLAEEQGIVRDPAEMDMLAERFALSRGGRSARAAKQFIDGLLSEE